MRHAQELEEQNESVSPLPIRRSVDPVALQNQANQLADLAASMPKAVQNANKGLLEKDLVQRLKRIEKLSKQLRNQLRLEARHLRVVPGHHHSCKGHGNAERKRALPYPYTGPGLT